MINTKPLTNHTIQYMHQIKSNKWLGHKLLYLIFFFCLLQQKTLAQDSTIIISSEMFTKSYNQANISSSPGWVYKPGNDTSWAAKDLNTSDWQKRNPTSLTVSDINSTGKVEGWFRIKIKISDTLNGPFYGLRLSTWAANDVYINGQLVLSTGNTGANGLPFKEYSFINKLSSPTNLSNEGEYVIALHFVDLPSPYNSQVLKSASNTSNLNLLIRITGKQFDESVFDLIVESKIFGVLWVSVCMVICFLLSLLYFQNPSEKNLGLIAITSLSYFLTMCFNTYILKSTFTIAAISTFFGNLMIAIVCILTTILIVRLFNRKINILLKISLASILIIHFIRYFYLGIDSVLGFSLSTINLVLLVVIIFFYILSSWKKLHGAQWVIVIGVVISLVSGSIYDAVTIFGNDFNSGIAEYTYITIFSLSFPLALVVYVAMRFKEIIKEVQENAKIVVQLSEEKKLQALQQKIILEDEVNRQTIELRNSIDTLKATQNQLIHSEKMASLGELTAGIAHEIQNPLNFVTNFSEVCSELVDEMSAELEKENWDQAKSMTADIKNNLQKINHHGKRADAIVKGMLQHSRKSDGKKELADINALCDEYLRLSYHGIRAKDKSFNSNLKTDFDPGIGLINIIPQDIGRVLLNLFTNAFYAVNEKLKQSDPNKKYMPTVSISTQKMNDHIEIKITDNGNGMPQSIKEKIFQPFFTTKPTGQGTGLGLSMCYDIITKAHNGTLEVDSEIDNGATFTITIPY